MSFQKLLLDIAFVSFIISEKENSAYMRSVFFFLSPSWALLLNKVFISVHDLRKGPAYCESLSEFELWVTGTYWQGNGLSKESVRGCMWFLIFNYTRIWKAIRWSLCSHSRHSGLISSAHLTLWQPALASPPHACEESLPYSYGSRNNSPAP